MSDLNQRTTARLEVLAPASAVTASTQSPDAAPWPEIDDSLLDCVSSPARRVAVPAFPLAVLAQPWRDWVSDAARSAGAPVDYVAQALLASVAGLGGRRVMVIPSPGWQEPLRLWLAAVGAPSTGKSPALASVLRLLWSLENDQTGDGRTPRRQIVLRDGSFDRIAGALAQDLRGMVLWRDAPAGCLAPLGRGRTLRDLESLAPSIVGTVEPDDLGKSRSSAAAGVASRFLYAWPPPMPFRPIGERLVLPGDDAVMAPLRRLLHVFGALQGPHGLFLEPPAALAFDAFRGRLHEETREAEGIQAAWLGKGASAVACLAGTFAVMSWSASTVDGLPKRVDLDSVERAMSLWSDYYRPHARAFLQRAAPEDRESHVGRVMRWLRTGGRATLAREDVRRSALGQSVSAGEADQVITRLVEGGVLRPLPRVSTGRAGRPALRWAVNPSLGRATSGGVTSAGSGAIFSRLDEDARLEWRAPGNDGLRVQGSANCANGANREIH